MTNRRWKCFTEGMLLILLFGMIIWGCDETPEITAETTEEIENTKADSEEEEIVIDEQYLIDNYGLTKEELEGIDVEDFIDGWVKPCRERRGYLDEETVAIMLTSYKRNMEIMEEIEEQERNKKDDYAGILEVEKNGGYEEEYQEEITVIAIEVTVGNYRESMILDLEQKVYYFGSLMDVTADYSQATNSGELSDEDIVTIRELLGETGVSGWDGKMGTFPKDAPDYNTFTLIICCSDGAKYGYKGYEFPNTFVTFYSELKKMKGL